jgi:hypothetical protein
MLHFIQTADWTSVLRSLAFLVALLFLAWPSKAMNSVPFQIGVFIVMIGLVIVIGAVLLVAGLVALSVHLLKRTEPSDIAIRIVKDPRSPEQLAAGAAIERRFSQIREQRGVDRYGRLNRAARGPSRLPYATNTITDFRDYVIRHQGG